MKEYNYTEITVAVPTRRFYLEYRKSRLDRGLKIPVENREHFRKVVSNVHKTIAHLWSRSTGGVYFDGYGYFSMLWIKQISDKYSFTYKNGVLDRLHTKGHIYVPVHINDFLLSDKLQGFTFNSSYHSYVRKGIVPELKRGRRWVNNIDLVTKFSKAKRNGLQ